MRNQESVANVYIRAYGLDFRRRADYLICLDCYDNVIYGARSATWDDTEEAIGKHAVVHYQRRLNDEQP